MNVWTSFKATVAIKCKHHRKREFEILTNTNNLETLLKEILRKIEKRNRFARFGISKAISLAAQLKAKTKPRNHLDKFSVESDRMEIQTSRRNDMKTDEGHHRFITFEGKSEPYFRDGFDFVTCTGSEAFRTAL